MPSVPTQHVLQPDASIDLQMHTTYSDGTWTPEQLMDYLVSEQFGLVAITDHDRVDTAPALQKLAAAKQLLLLTAVEISASWRGESTDVLCYGFDAVANELQSLTQAITLRQREMSRVVCEHLRKLDSSIVQDEIDVLLLKPSAQQLRELFALLASRGYSDQESRKMIKEAGFSAVTIDIAAAVEAAHRSGAVCLLAHPGRGNGDTRFDVALLDELRSQVPIDGFEVYYPAHTDEQIAMYRDYADRHLLLTSSGSDSHGPANKPIKYRAELSRRLLERMGIQFSE